MGLSKQYKSIVFLLACLLWAGCHQVSDNANEELPVLKEVFKDDFLIGAALNYDQFAENDIKGAELVKTQYNTITPENILKWEQVHPEPDSYNFDAVDQFVQFGEENGMFIVGHTLIWHNQTPDWVFLDDNGNPLNRYTLLERMRDHIHSVVGRYNGRIHGWDVVNEVLNDDGSLRESPWLEIIGEDYIEKAFEFAHEADPDAELYYNDYSLENPEKRAGAIELIKNLQAQDIPISGFGTQGYFSLEWPTPDQAEATVRDFANLDIDVMVTELDIDVLPSAMDYQGADISTDAEFEERLNPWPESLPDSVQDALSKRYAELFNVYYNNRDAVELPFGEYWMVIPGKITGLYADEPIILCCLIGNGSRNQLFTLWQEYLNS